MEEEKKDVVIEIPGLTPETDAGSKPKAPRPEFSPLPQLEEEKPAEPIIEIGDDGNIKTNDPQPTEEVKEEKPKKEKIKLNKVNTILSYGLVAIVVIIVIICLLEFTNVDFSKKLWLGFNAVVNDFCYSVMQHVPFISQYGLITFYTLFAIVVLTNGFFIFKNKDDIEMKNKIQNKFMPVLLAFGLVIAIMCYFRFSDASHRGINEIYLRNNISTEYKEEDLQNLVDYFKNRIITYAESLNRKNGQIELEKTPYEMAVDDLKNISFKYEFLKGSYPTKIRKLSGFDLSTYDYPVGLTYNYTVGIDELNLTDLDKIFVLTHEFCHVKGIVRESDADYCAFLAGFNSNNDISKYSMFVGLLPNLLSIMQDKDLARSIENEFGSVCLESGYYEICNLYLKDLNRFIKGSDTLVLETYSLGVYKDKKEELKQYIQGLKNRFNVDIVDSENNTQTIEGVNKLIDEGASLTLKITGRITSDTYSKNISYLRTMSNYFPHLYLKNSKEKVETYPGYNYLKPFPMSGNYATLTEKAPEYSYDRAVRSILEYFTQYVFN